MTDTAASTPALAVEDLSHRYGDHLALDSVSFRVEPGERFALLGPNGGGKTTLFRILTTLLRPSEGRILVEGLDVVRDPDAVRARLGVVFQSPALDPKLTVRENLLHHGHLQGLGGSELDRRIGEGLEAARLSDRAHAVTETLSGGLKRRVELVKVMLPSPSLVVLDEATTGLDPGARADFWQWIDQTREERGTTVLLTTHLMEEAAASDRVLLLDEGKVVALDTPEALTAELAGQVLTLRCADPEALEEALRRELDLTARCVGGAVRIETEDGKRLVQEVLSRFEGTIENLTLGRAGLEDVFLERTGHSFRERDRQDGGRA